MGEVFTFLGEVGGHGQAFILISHTILAVVISLILVKLTTKSLTLVPGNLQNVMEYYVEGVVSMGSEMMGEQNARKYLPLIGSIGFIVFVGNMIGIVPGFESPTANINLTLALALIVFIYYNYEGIKKQGALNYFKHFAGPVPILAPLMFPIEVISHISRIVSLSFRLFGNIKGDDMFLAVLLFLTPWLVPLPAFFVLFFFGLLQTFIFMILTFVYLAGAIMIEEEGH